MKIKSFDKPFKITIVGIFLFGLSVIEGDLKVFSLNYLHVLYIYEVTSYWIYYVNDFFYVHG